MIRASVVDPTRRLRSGRVGVGGDGGDGDGDRW